MAAKTDDATARLESALEQAQTTIVTACGGAGEVRIWTAGPRHADPLPLVL